MKIIGLAVLVFAVAAPALAQTSPSGNIGTLPPPASQTPDQAEGPATSQPAPNNNTDDRNRPVQRPAETKSQ